MGIVRETLITTSLACLLSACGGGELYDPPGEWRVPGWPAELAGDWAQVTLGGCVHSEEWLRLRPPSTLEHVVVDRNACEEGGVVRTGGVMDAAVGDRLDLSWGQQDWGLFRRFTAVVIQRWLAEQAPWPADYALGSRALNVMGYAPDDRRQTFVRTDWASAINVPDGAFIDQRIVARVDLDPPLAPGEVSGYRMRIRVWVQLDGGTDAPPAIGEVRATFDAWLAKTPETGWDVLIPDGFDSRAARSDWLAFLDEQGATNELPGQVVDRIAWWFVPVFVLDPSGSGRLFNDLPEAWYQEILSSPPERIE